MTDKGKLFGLLAALLLLALGVFVAACQSDPVLIMGYTDFSGLRVNGSSGTATPLVIFNQRGAGKIMELQDAGTPVYSVNDGGSVSLSGGQTFNNWLRVAAPTSIATATPAVVVDQAGVSSILELRDAATPVFSVYNGGNWSATGGGSVSNWVNVAAPTAIATATPAFVVNQAGVSVIMEARDSTTPVFSVYNGGDWYHRGAGSVAVPTAVATATPGFVVDNTGAGNVNLEVRKNATPQARFVNAGGLDMLNFTISNIGAAGTDFGSDGSLTTAQTITVTAGGLVVSAGGINATGNSTISGTLTMVNNAISNIGAAGTDFGSDGSLTTAQTITVTSGGLVVSSGATTLAGVLNANGGIAVDSLAFTVADTTGNAIISGTLGVTGTLTANGGIVLGAGDVLRPTAATNTGAEFALVSVITYTGTTTQTMAVLPANVDITDIQLVVTTQFNGSGTDVLDCGYTGGYQAYVTGLDVSAAGVNRMGDAGDMPYAAFGDIGVSNVTVTCIYTDQNSNASAGSATLVIRYVVR